MVRTLTFSAVKPAAAIAKSRSKLVNAIHGGVVQATRKPAVLVTISETSQLFCNLEFR